MMKKILLGAVASLVLAAGGASAATFDGKFYDVGGYGVFNDPTSIIGSPFVDSSADMLAYLAGNPTPDATFKSTSIGYGQQHIGSLANFLDYDAGSITAPAAGATSFLGSILTFAGTIRLDEGNNVFDVFSDDGFILYINDVIAGSFNGLRAPGSSLINVAGGTGGNVDFKLFYFEGSQKLAALTVKLNGEVLAPVPLPAGGLLLLGALGGIAALRRRKTA